jgi:glutamate decarboxylase
MVHLAGVPTDNHINENEKNQKSTLTKGLEKLQLGPTSGFVDTFTTSVYGSKFAAQDIPKNVMPEESMPKDVAYRLIKDDLSLDGNPMLK